jgi:YNFM family putative membrane transporter
LAFDGVNVRDKDRSGFFARCESGVVSGVSCYFAGGLVGSAILGQLFDHYGWEACVAGIAVALAIAMLLAARLRMPQTQ